MLLRIIFGVVFASLGLAASPQDAAAQASLWPGADFTTGGKYCKPVRKEGLVRISICADVQGSLRGDLVAFVEKEGDSSAEVSADCTSSFLTINGFKVHKSGGIVFLMGRDKKTDSYIISAQLNDADVNSWRIMSTNKCEMTVKLDQEKRIIILDVVPSR